MTRGPYILTHAAMASAFAFALQRYVLKQSLDTAMIWAVALGLAAALLAWKQTER